MRKTTAASCGCGHRATRRVLLAPESDRDLRCPAMLEINPQVGNPPVGTSIGIKPNMPDLLHFNKRTEEGGVTAFLPP